MKHRHKHDIPYSIITGVIAGTIAWRIAVFLDLPEYSYAPYFLLIVLGPAIWITAINFGYFLGKRIKLFNQFGRFSVVGVTNALIDFGILNLLIAYTGIHSGAWFPVFKGISFILANISSYLWNRYWTFEMSGNKVNAKEYTKYFIVSAMAMAVNVTAASVVVNLTGPMFGLNTKIWANVGAMAGSIAALIVNFIGYKLIVFKK